MWVANPTGRRDQSREENRQDRGIVCFLVITWGKWESDQVEPRRLLGSRLCGVHCLCYFVFVLSHSVASDSLQPLGLYSPWNSPGQNTGVGSLFLLQGIFPTQGSNPGLPHWRQADTLPAEPQGKPKNTGVDSLFLLQGIISTQESNRVSCIAGRFFTN